MSRKSSAKFFYLEKELLRSGYIVRPRCSPVQPRSDQLFA